MLKLLLRHFLFCHVHGKTALLFKKLKGQERRERHQATTNRNAVFAITGELFSENGHFCWNPCTGSLVSKGKRKYWKMSRRIHPAFQTKTVVKLECRYCERNICARGMRALLLADTKVELYSTDLPPEK